MKTSGSYNEELREYAIGKNSVMNHGLGSDPLPRSVLRGTDDNGNFNVNSIPLGKLNPIFEKKDDMSVKVPEPEKANSKPETANDESASKEKASAPAPVAVVGKATAPVPAAEVSDVKGSFAINNPVTGQPDEAPVSVRSPPPET